MFGMAYMFVHDGLVHRRFPVGPIAHVPYLRRVAAAHQVCHNLFNYYLIIQFIINLLLISVPFLALLASSLGKIQWVAIWVVSGTSSKNIYREFFFSKI